MPLLFKLIGQFKDNKSYQIRDNFEGLVTLNLLEEYFGFLGVNQDELSRVKFITEQIKNRETVYSVKSNEERTIFIFTSDIQLRNKLADIFMKEGFNEDKQLAPKINTTQTSNVNQKLVDSNICKPLKDESTEEKLELILPKLTNETIKTINSKSVSLFLDADFKSLISIYRRRPELFSTLAKFVQNGDIVETSKLPATSLSDLDESEWTYYRNLADKINDLGLDIPYGTIVRRLIRYSGHLNLTLRSLLCDQEQ